MAMPPQIDVHPTATDFLRAAEPWLERAEAEHNLLIGVARLMASSPELAPADWLTLASGGEIIGAVMRTPPHNPALTGLPADAVAAVVEFYRERAPDMAGVFAPCETAGRFVELWRSATGRNASVHMRQRVSCCRRPVPPPRAPGKSRELTEEDVPRLAEFIAGFHADTGGDPPPDDLHAAARRFVKRGQARGWDDEGALVASVNCGRETRHGATISFVYTPPERRGRGYAQSLVFDVTSRHLAAGKAFCCLFSDRDKPVPNHVYRKLGYEPLRELDWWLFDGP
jgi:predicted GNAT family acetyltransferase